MRPESRGQSYEYTFNRASERKKNRRYSRIIGCWHFRSRIRICQLRCTERYAPESAAGPDGCPVDPALRYDYDLEYVWHRSGHLYDLQYGVQGKRSQENVYAACERSGNLLNAGIGEKHSIEVEISPDAENAVIECDARLISRAVANLVQNSINHNPQGCSVSLRLDCSDTAISLTIADNGVGLSAEKLRELEEKPHYMESTDERLDLRHGLGLLLVRQIVEAHNGNLQIANILPHGCKITLTFPAVN